MPSFTDIVNGASALASDVQQIVDALKGTAGKGIPISVTAVNDAINYTLAVKNNDAGASKTFICYKADGTVLLQVDKNGVLASPDGTLGASQLLTATGPQTMTNKTLTAPTITSPTITGTVGGGATHTAPHMTAPVVDSGGLTVTAGGETITAGNLGVGVAANANQAVTTQFGSGTTQYPARFTNGATTDILYARADGAIYGLGPVVINGAIDTSTSLKVFGGAGTTQYPLQALNGVGSPILQARADGHVLVQNGSVMAYQQPAVPSNTGFVRLANNTTIGWRNAANNNDDTLGVDASDRLLFTGAAVTAGATAGANGAVPAQVAQYWPVVVNGTAYKIALFNT